MVKVLKSKTTGCGNVAVNKTKNFCPEVAYITVNLNMSLLLTILQRYHFDKRSTQV